MNLSNKQLKTLKKLHNQQVPIQSISRQTDIPEDIIIKALGIEEKKIQEPSVQDSNQIIHKIFIIFYAFLIFLAPLTCKSSEWYDFANLAQCLYIQNLSIFLLICWLAECLIHKQFRIKYTFLYWPIGLLIIYSGISLTWCVNVYEGLQIFYQWSACALIFFVIYNSLQSKTDIYIINFALALALLFVTFIGLRQWHDPSYGSFPQVIGPAATFGNKNMMNHFLIICIPIGLYLFYENISKPEKLINYFSLVLVILAATLVFLSHTRAGMIAIGIMVMYYFGITYFLYTQSDSKIFGKKYVFYYLGTALVVFFLLAFILPAYSKNKYVARYSYLDRISSVFKTTENDKRAFNTDLKDDELQPVGDSISMRKIVWRNTLSMINDNLIFGVGLYNWQIHYGDYRKAYYNDPTYRPGMALVRVHNDYLQILADLGLIGFSFASTIILTIIYYIFILCFRFQKNRSEVLCIWGGIFGILLVSIPSFPFEKAIPPLLFFIFIAEIIFLKDLGANQSKAKTLPFNALIPALIAAIISFVIVYNNQNKRALADQLFKTAFDDSQNLKADNAIEVGKKVLELEPLRAQANFIVGYSYVNVKKYLEAAHHIELALEKHPNDLNGIFQAGTAYTKVVEDKMRLGAPNDEIEKYEEKSLEFYHRALKHRNDFARVWNNMGFLMERRHLRYEKTDPVKANEALDKAIEYFSNACKFMPDYPDAEMNLADMYLRKGEHKKGAEYLERMIHSAMEKLEKKENRLKEIHKDNVQKSSRIFMEATNDLKEVSNQILLLFPKALPVLTNIYHEEKNYLKMYQVIERELFLTNLQLNTAAEELKFAQLQMADFQRTKMTRAGYDEAVLSKSINEKQIRFNTFQEKYNVTHADIHNRLANVKLFLNEPSAAISHLEKALVALKNNSDPKAEELKTQAYLLLVNIDLSVIDQNLPKKMPKIKENLQKANYTGNSQLNQFRDKLKQQMENIEKNIKFK